MTMEKTDIAMLTETKGIPPKMDGFTWFTKERLNGRGGGVAIAVRNNFCRYITQPDVIESNEMEIIWIALKGARHNTIHLGCYYGLQEKAEKEKVENEFDQPKTQIAMMDHKGPITLAGDFNAKIRMDEADCKQDMSCNGKILEQFLQETRMEYINSK